GSGFRRPAPLPAARVRLRRSARPAGPTRSRRIRRTGRAMGRPADGRARAAVLGGDGPLRPGGLAGLVALGSAGTAQRPGHGRGAGAGAAAAGLADAGEVSIHGSVGPRPSRADAAALSAAARNRLPRL